VALPSHYSIIAVATRTTVTLYESLFWQPVAHMARQHLAPLTDLAWTRDGAGLIVASQDRYVSVVSFEPGDLGIPLSQDKLPAHLLPGFNFGLERELKATRRSRAASKQGESDDAPAAKRSNGATS
jgi:hypothetical protein